MTVPSMEEMNKLIVEEVLEILRDIKLKNGQAAIALFGDHTHMYINPSGKFIVKSGLCRRVLAQLSYAISVVKPLSLFVETCGPETHITALAPMAISFCPEIPEPNMK